MIFTRDRSMTFFLIAAGIVVILTSMAVTDLGDLPINRHTGSIVQEQLPLNDPEIFRMAGSVRGSLDLIQRLGSRMSQSERLTAVHAILKTELQSAETPPCPVHPRHDDILREQSLAQEWRRKLPHLIGRRLTPAGLRRLLYCLEADGVIAKETESFFEITDETRPYIQLATAVIPLGGPDRFAAHAKQRVRRLARTERGPYLRRIADHFRAAERPRARIRWLLRSFEAGSDGVGTSPEAYQALIEAYLELGRVEEAFLILGAAVREHTENARLWRQRAQVAGWLSRGFEEIEALERLAFLDPIPNEAARAMRRLRWSGVPRKAVDYAARFAFILKSEAARKLCVDLALDAGDVERALDFIHQWIEQSDTPLPWRERFVEVCLLDLRLEDARRQLEYLNTFHGSEETESRLEELYRVSDDDGRLRIWLERKLELDPFNQTRRLELIGRLQAAGFVLEALEHSAQWLDHNVDAMNFFEALPLHHKAGDSTPRSPCLGQVDQLPHDPKTLHLVLDRSARRLSASTVHEMLQRFMSVLPDHVATWTPAVEILAEGPSNHELLASARKLHHAFPKSHVLPRLWAQYASWAQNESSEMTARKIIHRNEPHAHTNLERLTFLWEKTDRISEGIAFLESLIQKSSATITHLRLVARLYLQSDQLDKAFATLQRAVQHSEATLDDHVESGEVLFRADQLDHALAFFRVVLDQDPFHSQALLRCGQIHSWTGDPRLAISFLERHIASANSPNPEVLFYLGESYFAVGQPQRGLDHHHEALALMTNDSRETLPVSMKAKLMARVGDYDQALPLYERALDESPDDLGLILDFAEAALTFKDLETADALASEASIMASDDVRVLRLRAQVALAEDRFQDARDLLARSLELGGPKAAIVADIGLAHLRDGNLRLAQENFILAKRLQPQNASLADSNAVIDDKLAARLSALSRYRWVDDDVVLKHEVSGSALITDGFRLSTTLGYGSFRGQSQAVANGQEDITDRSAILDLGSDYTWSENNHWGVGIRSFPGFEEGADIGLWSTLYLEQSTPFQSVRLDVYRHDLFEDPSSAVPLGGRSSGLHVQGFRSLTNRLWTSVALGYDSLELDSPLTGDARDGRGSGSIDVGYNFLNGPTQITEPFTTRRIPPSLVGLIPTNDVDDEPYLGAWVRYARQQLSGNQELIEDLPLNKRVEFLTLSSRFDTRVTDQLAFSASAYLGRELEESQSLWGMGVDLQWRPMRQWEARLGGGFSSSVGRSDTDGSGGYIQAGVTLRW